MSTGIQWTDETWNPVVGCTKVSQGCKLCYAKVLHDRRHKAALTGKHVHTQYLHPFETVQLVPERLDRPLHWRKPRRVFVNSVSDLFHEDVPDAFIDQVFAVMAKTQRHTFQVLTKRPERMRDYCNARLLGLPLPNVWFGVSVENQAAANQRIPLLLDTPAAIRWLSCEPLLESVQIAEYLRNPLWNDIPSWQEPAIDWVVVGGESGADDKARPFDIEWARSLVRQCRVGEIPVFVKQLGRHPVAREAGVVVWPEYDLRDKHGGQMDEWPGDLRIREYPKTREVAAV